MGYGATEMTNPTLERAARALHERRSMWPWEDAGDEQRAISMGDASAVLMAVREPGEKGVEVGHDQIDFHDTTSREYQIFQLSIAFTAMIDAILADGGE